jgi:hypothetical protein
VVDVVVMAYVMVVVASAMASIGIDLMLTTSNGIDFEHFLAAVDVGTII